MGVGHIVITAGVVINTAAFVVIGNKRSAFLHHRVRLRNGGEQTLRIAIIRTEFKVANTLSVDT